MASSISSNSASTLPPVSGGGAQVQAVSNSDPAEETGASGGTETTSQASPAAPSGSGRGQNLDILV
ncbi:MAG: hypothetical protein JNL71_03750 [Rhodospirillales bacterium]|nr:hypothetical protein [Rhodospirillales bacterium]